MDSRDQFLETVLSFEKSVGKVCHLFGELMGRRVICRQMLSDLLLLRNASLGSKESQARVVELVIIILSALRGESKSAGFSKLQMMWKALASFWHCCFKYVNQNLPLILEDDRTFVSYSASLSRFSCPMNSGRVS